MSPSLFFLFKPFFHFPYFAPCLPRRASPPLFNIHTATAESNILRCPRPLPLSQSLEKWTKLLIKYEKQFLSTFLPAISPSSSSSYPFYILCPRHFSDSLSRIPPLTSKIANWTKLEATAIYRFQCLSFCALFSSVESFITELARNCRARPLPMGFLKLRATLTVALSLFHPLTTYNANLLESFTRLFHLMTLPRTQAT